MDKKRLDYLDMVKFVGIFFVVLGHVEYISDPLRVWISSYHMPLFFIVSGLLMAVKNEPEKDLGDSVRKKFRGIIIPYLWFSLAYFIIDIGNVCLSIIDMRTFILDTISSVTFYGMSVLWFLPALFIVSVAFLFLKKHFPDWGVIVATILLAVGGFFLQKLTSAIYATYAYSYVITALVYLMKVFARAGVALPYLVLAYYIRKGCDIVYAKYPVLSKKYVALPVGIVMLGINIYLSTVNGAVDMHYIILNNPALYYIGAFLGTYGIVLICKCTPPFRLCLYYGRNSLIIMAVHVNFYILYAALRIAFKVNQYTSHAKHYIFLAVTMVCVFALCTIVIELINRFFPFVCGKPFQLPWKKTKEKND